MTKGCCIMSTMPKEVYGQYNFYMYMERMHLQLVIVLLRIFIITVEDREHVITYSLNELTFLVSIVTL